MSRVRLHWLAALFSVSAACGGGATPSTAPRAAWERATALTADEDSPSGVVVAGASVLFTTGRTQVGDNAVRIAPLEPASAPASRVLVAIPGNAGPNGPLAVDGGDVYVAAGSGVVRVSMATGQVTPVVTGRPTGVTSVAVDARYVWWTTSTYKAPLSTEVARIPKAGGPVEVLAAGSDDKGAVYQDDPVRKAVALPDSAFHALVLDGDGAFVANPGALLRVAAGRPPQVVLDGSRLFGGALAQVAADADRLYGLIAGGHGQLFAVSRAGGPPVELARDSDSVNGITVAGGEVIFMTAAGSGGREDIKAVPVTGGPARVLTSGRYADGDLAVAGDRLVFSADSRVWSVPLRAG